MAAVIPPNNSFTCRSSIAEGEYFVANNKLYTIFEGAVFEVAISNDKLTSSQEVPATQLVIKVEQP